MFLAALVFGALLHLDLPVARRVVMSRVSSFLDDTFEGRIEIERIGRLGISGVYGLDGRVSTQGGDVIVVRGARARISLPALVRSALSRRRDIDVDLRRVSVDYAEVGLMTDESGTPWIERAFRPKHPAPHPAPSQAEGRKVRFAIDRADVKHAWVHGRMPGLPPFDLDADATRGSVLVSPARSAVDVPFVHLTTRGAPRGADLDADAEAHLAFPSQTEPATRIEGALRGTVGGLPVSAHALLSGSHVEGQLAMPPVAAERVRALIPEAPVHDALGLVLEVHGELPRLDGRAHVTLGPGSIDAALVGTTSGALRALIELDRMDLRSFSPTAPRSRLAAAANVRLVVNLDGTIRGDFSLDTRPGTVGGALVPKASLRGEFTERTAQGHGTIAEPGAPTKVSLYLRPEGRTMAVGVTATTSIARLDRVPRVKLATRGSAKVTLSGTIRLDGPLDAELEADLKDIAASGARMARAHLYAHTTGTVADMSIDTTIGAEDLAASGLSFTRGRVTAHGSLTAQRVAMFLEGAGSPDVTTRADVEIGRITSLRGAEVVLSRAGVRATARADEVRISGREVRVTGGIVEGLGSPARVTVLTTRKTIALRADSKGIELEPLGRLFHLEREVHGGRVAFDVDLSIAGSGAEGRVSADLAGGSFFDVRDGSAHVDLGVQGRRVSANVDAALGRAARAHLETSGAEVGGAGFFAADSWKKAVGRIGFDAKLDLGILVALLPDGTLPFDDARGTLAIEGNVARPSLAASAPELRLAASTQGLALGARARRIGTAPWRLSGSDLQLSARVDAGGASALSLRLSDEKGVLLALDASSRAIPLGQMLADPGQALARLESVRFAAECVIPERSIADFPAVPGFFDARGAHGTAQAVVRVEGTATDPSVAIEAKTSGVQWNEAPVTVPLSAEVRGRYDGTTGDLGVKLFSRRGDKWLDGSLHLARGGGMPWSLSTHVRAFEFPVGSVGVIGDRQIRGHVSGELVVDDLHRDGRASLRMDSKDLQLGASRYTSAEVSVSVDDRRIEASIRFDEPDGSARASATIPSRWGAELLPEVDGALPLSASVIARHFRAAGLLPFVEGTVSDLDGRIDADARAEGALSGGKLRVEGTVLLSDGLVQVESIGEEFHGVRGKVTLVPDGTVRLEDVVAYGVTGKVMASGSARMDGLTLKAARAVLRIPKGQAIPLDVQGTQVGDVHGSAELAADASPDGKAWTVAVQVPELHVSLPLSSAHHAQRLDEPEDVHAGVYLGKSGFVLLALDQEDTRAEKPSSATRRIDVSVHLGNDVDIKRGTDLLVAIEGDPKIEVANEVRVTGQIRLKSGYLKVQGRRFEIEKGTIAFVGPDPSNPEVVVTAGWTAPDGTRVFADFSGPLKTGKVNLRSEPARPKNEILALILFGSAEGSSATPYATQASPATAAASASGAFAAQGLSQGIDQLTGLEVTAKVDTSSSTNPRPEVEVRIARDISLQIAFVLGTPPPGTNPDRTFATLDWRFAPRWSLATTFGDQGSSMADVIWQCRY